MFTLNGIFFTSVVDTDSRWFSGDRVNFTADFMDVIKAGIKSGDTASHTVGGAPVVVHGDMWN